MYCRRCPEYIGGIYESTVPKLVCRSYYHGMVYERGTARHPAKIISRPNGLMRRVLRFSGNSDYTVHPYIHICMHEYIYI